MKRHVSIFALLLGALAAVGLSAFAADLGDDVMRLSPIGYRLGVTGGVTAYDPSVVTVTPGDTSIVTLNKPVTLTAVLNRDYKVIRWQKFDVDPSIRTTADPIEEFGEKSETVSVELNPNVEWMYVAVVVEYDPVRTVKASVSSFGEGSVSVSPEKTSYLKGDVITLTAEPAEGYDFVRWSDGNTDHVRTLTVVDDIDLKAYIEPKASRVSFSAGDGAVLGITEKIVRFGCAYGELPVPQHDGWIFIGWKDEFGTVITSESTSTCAGDHVLTADWEIPPESYIVVFDANGGTGLQTRVEQKFEVGVSQKLRVNTFYYPGHVFVGWNQNAGAEEKQYFDEQIVQDLAPAGASLTLFAVWRAEKVAYTVHFDKNAADATGEMINQQFAGGEEKPLSGCNFRRTGWTFLGWSTDSGAIEATYQDREKVQDLTTEKELTLYAVWTRNPVYYVKYMAMDRDTEPWKSETVEQGKEYTLSGTNGLERMGYTFNGWTNGTAKATYPVGKKCTTQELAKMVDDGDTITFVAVWKPITYTIKFNGNGATTCEVPDKQMVYDKLPKSIDVDTTDRDNPPKMRRTGYDLVGFSPNASGAGEVFAVGTNTAKTIFVTITNNLTAVDGTNVTLYALWKGEPQTVTINGGVTNVAYGSQLQQPADPVKTGYAFAGKWHTNNNVIVTFPITVTGSFSLDSEDKWTTNEYTVVFNGTDADGGAMEPQEFTYDVEQALTSNAFTRTGYTFANWTNGVGTAFADGARVKNLATNDGAVVDLYATWTINPRYYAVRFNPNGGEGAPYLQGIECGVETALTSNRFTRTGYGFANWTDAEGTNYVDGAKVTDLAAEGETNDLWAAWTPNRYWAAFDGNGADGGAMDPQAFTYDVEQALSSNAFTKTGHSFGGWATNKTGAAVFIDKVVVSNLTSIADGTNTLWATWTPNKYTVVIDDVPTEMDYGSDIAEPADPAAREGYTFTGWTTNGAPVAVWPLKVPLGGLTILSAWAPNTYTVEFRGTDGTYETRGTMEPQAFSYDMAQPLSANGFVRDRYVFEGWTNGTGRTFANQEVVSNLTAAADGVVTLWATWTDAPSYTVRFNSNGGEGAPYLQGIFCGVETALTSNRFTRTGYGFANWTDAEGTNYVDGAKVTDLAAEGETNDLWAAWTPNRYWVKFDKNGADSGAMEPQAFTYDVSQALSSNAFTKTGHSFGGWATNKTSAAVFIDKAVVSNLTSIADGTNTLWATWRANKYTVVYHGPGGATSEQPFTYDVEQNLKGADTFAPPETWMMFAGWTNAVAVGKVYAAGETVSNLTDVADGTFDLYAKWTDDSYMVSFDGNGNTGGSMEPQIFKHGGTGTLTPNAYVRTGFGFKNWTNDTGHIYSDGSNFSASSSGAGETLHAVWTNCEYYCWFDSEKDGPYHYGDKIYERSSTNKLGYVFLGWTNETGIVDLKTFTMPDHDVTFGPKWEPITYTIAFNGNGTTTVEMAPTNVKYDVEFTLPSNTYVWAGHEFVHWTNSVGKVYNDGATVKNLATTDGETVTLYAAWKEAGDPLRMALGLGPEFDGNKVSVSAEGAWTVIEPAKEAKGVTRTSESSGGQLRVAVPSAGTLQIDFDAGGSIMNGLTYSDGSHSATKKSGGKYSIGVESACTVTFSGTPDSGCTWTLKNFIWTAR